MKIKKNSGNAENTLNNSLKSIKNINLPYFIFQIIFSLYFINQIISNNIYNSYNTPFQLIAYLLIYNLTFLLFYNLNFNILKKRTSTMLYFILGASILYIYIISYYPVMELNGDNAAYLSRAKSIMLGKGFRALWLPNEPFESSLKGIGFSLLNIPFIYLFGINNYIGLQLLPFFSVIAGLFLMYHYFKNKIESDKLFLLMIIITLYSQIIHFASITMTESISFALLFLIFFLIENDLKNAYNMLIKKIFVLAIIALITFFSFTIREALIAFIPAAFLYYIANKRWKEALIFCFFSSLYFCGYLLLSSHLKQLNTTFHLIDEGQKTFASATFLQQYLNPILTNIKNINLTSLKDVFLVLSQKVLGDPDRYQYDQIIGNLIVILIILLGIYYKYKNKTNISIYDIYALILIPTIIFFWGSQTDYVVFSRYFYSLIPIIFYYFILGIVFLCGKFKNKLYPIFIFLVIFSFSLNFSFQMNLSAVYSAKHPYPPAVQNFISACDWIKNATPKNVIIANRKSTLAFIWADRKSMHYFDDSKYSRYDNYSDQFEKDTLEYYKKNNIDYIILDAFSPDAYYKILPIVRNNIKVFQVIFMTPKPETYVLKINKDIIDKNLTIK